MFSATTLATYLPAQPKLQLQVAATMDSTNAAAMRALDTATPVPLLVTTDTQTAGRGRGNHQFVSPPGTGLYFSYAFAVQGQPSPLLTPAAGVALQEAISAVTGVSTKIKWVNDLLLEGKKVAGILAEYHPTRHSVVVGCGVDLLPHPTLATAAPGLPIGTLFTTPPETDLRPALIGAWVKAFNRFLLTPQAIMPAYNLHAAWLNEQIVVTGTGLTGKLLGFSADGAVRLVNDTGEHLISSGSIRRV